MTQTIELTGKKLKAQLLLSAMAAAVSVVLIIVFFNTGTNWTFFAGFFGFTASMIWFIITKIIIWWQHA